MLHVGCVHTSKHSASLSLCSQCHSQRLATSTDGTHLWRLAAVGGGAARVRVGAAVCIAVMQFCHKALVLHARGPGGSKGLQGLVDCQPTGLHEVAADHKACAIKACMAKGHYWRWLQVLTYTPGIAPARLLQYLEGCCNHSAQADSSIALPPLIAAHIVQPAAQLTIGAVDGDILVRVLLPEALGNVNDLLNLLCEREDLCHKLHVLVGNIWGHVLSIERLMVGEVCISRD